MFKLHKTTLGAICEAQNGSIQTGPFGSQLHASDYVETGIPVVMPANIGANGGIFESGISRIQQHDANRLSQHKLQVGDVVFSRRGDVTRNALIEKHQSGWLCGTGCLKVRFGDESLAQATFISYYLRLPETKDWLFRHAIGATMPNLNTTILSAVPIKLPPLRFQKEISGILAIFDMRINSLEETNATLEAIAQALFKSWFVDFDPVRSKQQGQLPDGMDEATTQIFPDSFENIGTTLLPKDWHLTTLGKIAKDNGGSIQTGPFGSQLHASDYVSEGIPVVMPKDISNRRVDAASAAKVSSENAARLARHQLQSGDIIFSRRGDVEKHALIDETEEGWLCGTGCLLVRPGKQWKSPSYLSYSLELAKTKRWLTQHAVGATMPNINTKILSDVPVLLPSEKVLSAFEGIASLLNMRISKNIATINTLSTIRDSILPRLISGQIRMPEGKSLIETSEAL